MARTPEGFFDGWDAAKAKTKAAATLSYGAKALEKVWPGCVERRRLKEGANPFQEAYHKTGARVFDEMTAFKADARIQTLLKGFFKSELWKKFAERLEESKEAAIVFNVVGAGDWVVHARRNWRRPDAGRPLIMYSGSEGGTVVIQEMAQLVERQ
jgi:hypothetical protein